MSVLSASHHTEVFIYKTLGFDLAFEKCQILGNDSALTERIPYVTDLVTEYHCPKSDS